MTDETHIIRLERDLGRLEGIVGELVRGIAADRANATQQRADLFAYIEAAGKRNEVTISELAEQIKALAKQEAGSASNQARTSGQWALSRWMAVTVIAVASLSLGWLGGATGPAARNEEFMQSPEFREQLERALQHEAEKKNGRAGAAQLNPGR